MAKTSMINKQQKEPKFSTRAYTRCRLCGRPHSVLRKYGVCRICFRELAYKGEIPGVRKALDSMSEIVEAVLIQDGQARPVKLRLPSMTREERDIVLAGCLINYYAK